MENAPEETCSHLFYREVLEALRRAGIPFLISGGFALERVTGILRDIKDLDIFILESDVERSLQTLAAAGYRTELTFSHWLAKVFDAESTHYVDLIFSSGNGLCRVDPTWFGRAVPGKVFDLAVLMCAPEEMLWQKSFIMERERYDGADVAHIIRAHGEVLDWQRLIKLFDAHWRVLLSHVVLFDYIYPSERRKIPAWVRQTLARSLEEELARPPSSEKLCRGPFISRAQFQVDVETWGYQDARLAKMSSAEVAEWSTAGKREAKTETG